jgi:hypothetical protein
MRERLDEMEEETGETPAALERRPQLLAASQNMLYQAFLMLHMMRTSNGFGPNPITLIELNAYEDRFGKLPIDSDLLLKVVKQLDEVALKWIGDKLKAKSKVT